MPDMLDSRVQTSAMRRKKIVDMCLQLEGYLRMANKALLDKRRQTCLVDRYAVADDRLCLGRDGKIIGRSEQIMKMSFFDIKGAVAQKRDKKQPLDGGVLDILMVRRMMDVGFKMVTPLERNHSCILQEQKTAGLCLFIGSQRQEPESKLNHRHHTVLFVPVVFDSSQSSTQ
jgi:hypothetical protein